MRKSVLAQSHLQYRSSGYHWRRRWPSRVLKIWTPSTKFSLLFPLRSHVLPEAKALAQKLTLLSDIAFAGVTERTMAIAPDIMDRLLVGLCRFLIEAADEAREMAPLRSADAAAYDFACANAAVETLRHAIVTRDREVARDPLRMVANRLGIKLDETDADWQRLRSRARLATGRRGNIWRHSTMPPSEPRHRPGRSSWPSPTRRRNGRAPRKAAPILHLPPTT